MKRTFLLLCILVLGLGCQGQKDKTSGQTAEVTTTTETTPIDIDGTNDTNTDVQTSDATGDSGDSGASIQLPDTGGASAGDQPLNTSSPEPLHDEATEHATGNLTDRLAPTASNFAFQQSGVFQSMALATLSCFDNDEISAVRISENAAQPAIDDPNWRTVSTPERQITQNLLFTLSANAGAKTVYAWCKDMASNISPPVSTQVTLMPPGLQYGTTGNDRAREVHLIGSELFLTGDTTGSLSGFTNRGGEDTLLTKVNVNNVHRWDMQLGSNSRDLTLGSGASGTHVALVGWTFGSYANQAYGEGLDAFVSVITSGGSLAWVRQISNGGDEKAHDAAFDGNGNILVALSVSNAFNGGNYRGGSDLVLVKYNASGQPIWSVQYGGSASDEPAALAVDSAGNAYVAGVSTSTLSGIPHQGQGDPFVLKVDVNGQPQLVWYGGTSKTEQVEDITLDGQGGLYLVGSSYGSMDGTTSGINGDGFLVKLASQDLTHQWTRQLGTNGYDSVWGLAASASAGVFVTGLTEGALVPNALVGQHDLFLAKYDASGALQWIRQTGTTANDFGADVTLNGTNAVVLGYTAGAFDTNTNVGGYDLILLNYNALGERYR